MSPSIKYFSAERLWCTAGAAVAIMSIVVALWFLFKVRQPFQTGMAYPFLLLGLIFFAICLSVELRSNADMARVEGMIANDLSALTTEEIPRMATVMRSFTIIITLEAVFISTSVALLWWVDLSPVWKGAMTGLLIQAGWLFVFDLFARGRGKEYADYLYSLITPAQY